MRIDVWAGIALMAAVACPATSRAETLKFGASGVAGTLALSLKADPNTGSLPSTPPNAFDPIGAQIISGVSGTFSDANAGLANEVVTGVVPLNRVAPEASNLFAPYSFSLLPVKDGVNEGNGVVSPGLHYDNLFYQGGSPRTASDYPFHGGVLDIYGVAFTLANGDSVDLWSNGVVPNVGLNYGVAVTDGTRVLDYTSGFLVSAVPLPASAPMFGVALVALGAAGYGLKRRAKAAA